MQLTGFADKLKTIPRNDEGNPHFENLSHVQQYFTDDEITELVNRSVYQLEYQKIAHKKYHNQNAELERPVRKAFKELYPGKSFSKATDEQFEQALLHAKKTS